MKRLSLLLLLSVPLLSVPLLGVAATPSLDSQFVAPDKSYRPMPFWHLNGTLQRSAIRRQMVDAQHLCGFGGVTVLPVTAGPQHPTGKPCPGMRPAYLSDEYFARYDDMLHTADSLQMELIVYDDVDFPSGSAGGRLRAEYPQYTRKQLAVEQYKISGGEWFSHKLAASDALQCMAVSAFNPTTRQVVDLMPYVQQGVLTWQAPEGEWLVMCFNCRYRTSQLVDYMEPAAVDRVMSMTYDRYAQRYEHYFGNTIRKIFFDDVGYVGAEQTWTPAITRLFEERTGRSAARYYPALYYDIGPETAAARVAFYDIRAELMAEGYVRAVGEWCERHGLQSIGHPPGNYRPNSTDMHGDILKYYRHTQIPLTDYIFYYGFGRDGFKQVSSAADLYDRPVVGAEACGAFAADMDSLMLYRVTLDLLARGVNFIVPHGMWYQTESDSVRIPPLISAENPRLAAALPQYSEFVARCCALLQGGRRVSDIAVLYPIASTQGASQFAVDGSQRGHEGGALPPEVDFQRVGSYLTTALRRDFTFVHPESFIDGRIVRRGAHLVLNNRENRQQYKLLILSGGDVLSAATMARVRDFYEHGGKVMATSALPTRSAEFDRDEELRQAVEAVFGSVEERSSGEVRRNRAGGEALFVANPSPTTLRRALDVLHVAPDVQTSDTTEHYRVAEASDFTARMSSSGSERVTNAPDLKAVGGSFCALHKQKGGRDIYLFTNSSNDTISTGVELRGKLALQLWNPYTGAMQQVPTAWRKRHGVCYTCFDLELLPVKGVFVVGR